MGDLQHGDLEMVITRHQRGRKTAYEGEIRNCLRLGSKLFLG
jgi:hypothetical protein